MEVFFSPFECWLDGGPCSVRMFRTDQECSYLVYLCVRDRETERRKESGRIFCWNKFVDRLNENFNCQKGQQYWIV